MGDPTHDKFMWRDLAGKADQVSRGPLPKHLPVTRIFLFYYFTSLTNTSDFNGGLSSTTFL